MTEVKIIGRDGVKTILVPNQVVEKKAPATLFRNVDMRNNIWCVDHVQQLQQTQIKK